MNKEKLSLLNEARKYAGLEPIVERYEEDDDDEDRDAKIAASDKKQQEFEKKNKKTLDSDAAAIAAAKKAASEKAAAKKENAKHEKTETPAEEKKEHSKDEKKEDAPTETAAEEKATKEKKARQARAWIAANPEAKAGDFKKIAQERFGIGKHYANTFWYAEKSKAKKKAAGDSNAVAECYVLAHPTVKGYYLAENLAMNQYQWVDEDSDIEAMIFEDADAARNAARSASDWRGTNTVITHIVFE